MARRERPQRPDRKSEQGVENEDVAGEDEKGVGEPDQRQTGDAAQVPDKWRSAGAPRGEILHRKRPAEQEGEQEEEFRLEQGCDDDGGKAVGHRFRHCQHLVGRQRVEGQVDDADADQREDADCIDAGVAAGWGHDILRIERLLNRY